MTALLTACIEGDPESPCYDAHEGLALMEQCRDELLGGGGPLCGVSVIPPEECQFDCEDQQFREVEETDVVVSAPDSWLIRCIFTPPAGDDDLKIPFLVLSEDGECPDLLGERDPEFEPLPLTDSDEDYVPDPDVVGDHLVTVIQGNCEYNYRVWVLGFGLDEPNPIALPCAFYQDEE